jgi:transcriptional regulator with XRE-family HTH domain
MRAFGRQERRVREFLGMSQEQLARLAGVSQGAVSRLEAGRGLATPMLVVLKINLALRAALRDVDPALLSDDLRRVLEIEERISPRVGDVGIAAAPVTKDPALEDVVRLYRGVPERQRDTFLSVVRAAAEALSSQDGALDEPSSKQSG